MRVLVVIPHFYRPGGPPPGYGRLHASFEADPRPRSAALSAAIAALHQLYGPAQNILDPGRRTAPPANATLAGTLDVVVCTTGPAHLLSSLKVPAQAFEHRATDAEPLNLGFECHAVLRERLGAYDYYGYIEDDLIARDPWLFAKLAWFNGQVGDEALLLPNRYEVGPLGPVHKVYIDGDPAGDPAAPFQDRSESPILRGRVLGLPLTFQRPRNPHAGCFFLNARQMAAYSARHDFLDRDASYIGPLESAATLGVMRAFRIYKPAPDCASFLEIEHFGTSQLGKLRRRSQPT